MKLSEIFKRNNTREAAGTSFEPAPYGIGNATERTNLTNDENGNLKAYTNWTTSQPSLNPITTHGPEACNCSTKLSIVPSGSPKEYHKDVIDRWSNLMNEPDDKKRINNVNLLSSLKRTEPSADTQHEFQNHFLMHLYGAGMTHRDLGISDDELGEEYKQSQQLAQSSQAAARNVHHYNQDNCGVCQQYLDSYKNNVRNYKNGIDNAAMMSTGTKHEDTGKSASELAGAIYDDYQTGSQSRTKDSSVVAAHNTLSNWDKHLSDSHGYTFNSNFDPYTPVVNNNDSKSFVRGLYKKVKGLTGGWSSGKEEKTTRNPFEERDIEGNVRNYEDLSTKEKKKIDIIKKRQTFNEPTTIAPAINEYPLPKTETPEAYESRMDLYEQGVLSPIQVRKDRGGADKVRVELPNKTIVGIPPKTYINEDFSTDIRGGQFSTIPKPPAQQYNAKEDPRNMLFQDVVSGGEHPEIIKPSLREGINASLPRQHKYLFQKAGIEPDTAGLKEYSRAQHAYENQPTHTSHDTGRTETVEEPQYEERNFIERDGKLLPYEETYQKEHKDFMDKLYTEGNESLPKHFNGKPLRLDNIPYYWFDKQEEQWKNDWHSKNSKTEVTYSAPSDKFDKPVENRRTVAPIRQVIPKLDENGKQVTKTTTKPVYETRPIPAEQMIPAPSPETLENAKAKYNSSFESALSKAYPQHSREEALEALNNEHQGVVSNLEEQHQRSLQTRNRRINASKETIMFNSKNKKESATDFSAIPGMIEHGIRDVGHMLNTVRNQVDQARQNKNQGEKGDATVQLLAEGIGSGIGGKKLLDKYKNWVNSDKNGKPYGQKDEEGPRQASLQAAKSKIEALAKKKVCEKCGKNCSDKKECKTNIDAKRRETAADNAYND